MYSPEVRERAVRMVSEHRGEYPSEWAAICSIAEKFGCSSETLRKWVRQAETDQGVQAGLSTDQQRELRPVRFRLATGNYQPDRKRSMSSTSPVSRACSAAKASK